MNGPNGLFIVYKSLRSRITN